MELEVSTVEKQVFVDEVQLQSALINLVVNSRHAMPDGGTVRLIAAAKNSNETKSEGVQEKIRISVIDTGVGMTPAVKARATEPFYTTKPTGKGFGLGLSVIDAFAKESGGALVIESTVGAGTSVHIDLPVHVTEDRRAASGAVAEPRSGCPDDEAQKILLVEDSAELRTLLSRQLDRLEGFSVTAVSTGDAAIALAEAGERFDLVISDISLPGKTNGFDACRRILGLCPSQPIIFMTGFSQQELADDDPLAQYESLRKPFEFADLQRAIISALH
jgi:CheY-like chemotaxis protein/anti-sigma regulatory factor (Ser/Thr protein kinase)